MSSYQPGATFIGHHDEVSGVAMTADAQYMISSGGAVVALWDRTKRQCLDRVTVTESTVGSVAIEPTLGVTAFTKVGSPTIRVGSAPAGTLVSSQFRRWLGSGMWPNAAHAVGFVRGKLASVHSKGKVVLWDLATENAIYSAQQTDLDHAEALIRSSGDLYFVKGQGVIRAWDHRGATPALTIQDADLFPCADFDVSPDGRYLTVCKPNGELRLWNLVTPGVAQRWQQANASMVRFVSDSEIASASQNRVKFWGLDTAEKCEVARPSRRMTRLAVSHSEEALTLGDLDGGVTLLEKNPVDGASVVYRLGDSPVWALDVDDDRLAWGTTRQFLTRNLPASDGDGKATDRQVIDVGYPVAAVMADGGHVARTGICYETVTSPGIGIDSGDHESVVEFPAVCLNDRAESDTSTPLAFSRSRDGSIQAVGWSSTLNLYQDLGRRDRLEVATGEPLGVAIWGATAALSLPTSIQFRNMITGKKESASITVPQNDRRYMSSHKEVARGHSMAFSGDGSRLAAARHHHLMAWDMATKAELLNVDLGALVTAVAWSPDGDTLAFCTLSAAQVELWSVSQSTAMPPKLSLGNGYGLSLVFNGTDILAIGTDRGAVEVWDLAQAAAAGAAASGGAAAAAAASSGGAAGAGGSAAAAAAAAAAAPSPAALARLGELLLPINYHQRPPTILIFKGGGAKGLAHIGAVQACEAHVAANGKALIAECLHAAGTSAGSIMAAFVACGFSSAEMIQHYRTSPHASKVASLVPTKMINPSNNQHLTAFVEDAIKLKTGKDRTTFKQLRKRVERGDPGFRHLHVIALDTASTDGTFRAVHISSDNPQWNDLIISEAVVASASFPGAFWPQVLVWKKKRLDGTPYFGNQHGEDWGSDYATVKASLYGRKAKADDSWQDGGMADNLPVKRFGKLRYFAPELAALQGDRDITNPRLLAFSLGQRAAPSAAAAEVRSSRRSSGALIGVASQLAPGFFDADVPVDPDAVEQIFELDVGTLETTDFSASPTAGEGQRVVAQAKADVLEFLQGHQGKS